MLNQIQTDTLWDPTLQHHVMKMRGNTIPKVITDYDSPTYDPNSPNISQKRMNGFLMGSARQLDREGKERDTRLAARTQLLADAVGLDFKEVSTKEGYYLKTISDQGQKYGKGTEIKVAFAQDFSNQLDAEPMIVLTPRSAYQTYYISEVNKEGFTVVVKTDADDFRFNWQATAKVAAKPTTTDHIDDVFYRKPFEITGEYPTLDYEAERRYKEAMLKDANANIAPNADGSVAPITFPANNK